MDSRPHILDWDDGRLSEWLSQQAQKPFRLKQIKDWIYQRRAESFADMSDLPATLRQSLENSFLLWTSRGVERQIAGDGTQKLLVDLADGGRVECVLLIDGTRRSICVSSQVGCAMGCVFCASGLDGVDRNLTRGEILEQMLRLQRCLPADERLSHIVMMGMGEPLANLDKVISALDEARNPMGLGISPRRITISTVGLPPAIDRLAAHPAGFNLAVSLHAPNDELRNKLVPINRKIGLAAVLAASDRYFAASGRQLTFEYVLLGGINDSMMQARELVRLLRARNVLLNVIPYNPVAGLPYQTPSGATIHRFRDELLAGGLNVKFRQRKGSEIDAACGQLRRLRSKLVSLNSPNSNESTTSVP